MSLGELLPKPIYQTPVNTQLEKQIRNTREAIDRLREAAEPAKEGK